jgi:hypothetical protein
MIPGIVPQLHTRDPHGRVEIAAKVGRREFISLLGNATSAWPLAVPQPEMHVLRYLAAALQAGRYIHGEHGSWRA